MNARRLLKILFLLCAVSLPLVATAQFNLIVVDGKAIVTGYTGQGGAVIIPSVTNGWTVIDIGNSAFLNKSNVTAVTIPDTVTNIGNSAFESCSGMTNVTIGQGVAIIGDSAFKSCTRLASAAIPDSVIKVGTNVFYSCAALTNVTLGAHVPSIGNSDFQECADLVSVAIPSSITNIGAYAFYHCTKLGAVTLTNSVVSIGKFSFMYCYSLTNLVIPNSVRIIDDSAFFECGNLAGLAIPDSVTNIADNAFCLCSTLTNLALGTNLINIGTQTFSDCSKLDNVIIPDSVTSIGTSTFSGCTSVTNVAIGQRVSQIGDGSFWNCWALKSIMVNPANSQYSSVDGVMFDKNQSTLIQFPQGAGGSYAVPNTVTSIGFYAFYQSSNLANVTIPSSVTNIGTAAFDNCTGLTAISVDPDNLFYSSVNGVLFDKNQTILITFPGGLSGSYTVPNGVTNIYFDAFDDCHLSSVTISASVTSAGDYAFESSPLLTAVFFQGNAPGTDFQPSAFSLVNATVFYLPGTTGWGSTFAGLPTALWNPQVQTSDGGFGFQANQFGFNITGTTNIPIVVEACTNLANAAWILVQNCTLTNGVISFSDSQSTNYPSRFYRIRSP
jgi:hypothetical protein